MYKRQLRIPTIVALIILIFGLGGSLLLVETSRPLTSSADATIIPSNLHISNVSDSQFSVSWLTAKETTGYISYSDQQSSFLTAFDDRDEDGKPKNYIAHHVTVKNLKENTTYVFKIYSGKVIFDNKGENFRQNTGPKIVSTLSLNPAYGTIADERDKPISGALVYLTLGKGLPLSTLVKEGGTWLIPLNNVRTQDLLGRPEIASPEVIQISILFSENMSSYATTDTANSSPVPVMNLGKSYDFRNLIGKKKAPVAKKADSPNVLGTVETKLSPTPSKAPNIQHKVDLLFPDKNQATTIDAKPLIKGTGIPGKELIITVNSTPQLGKVTIASDGTWSFIPRNPLSSGTHTVSITTTDGAGKSVTLSRQFIVLKSGERVLGDATPSGNISPTLFPTDTPFVTFAPIVSTTPPVTGSISPTYAFLAFGMMFVLLGMKYLFLP